MKQLKNIILFVPKIIYIVIWIAFASKKEIENMPLWIREFAKEKN